ncbi:glycosyltransferase family 4 protein [Flavobacterium sp. FlaQc-57]|uniref:glycosyltransferase family 4 protein n=1 Tax=Flavobacterium sp. FlaQc-57 TaxID=3374186 RepID=UPI003756FE0E
MKILYDHQIFSFQMHGGISRYFIELIKGLPGNYKYEISVLFSENVYLLEEKKTFSLKPFFLKSTIRIKLYKYINLLYTNYRIKKGNFDVFHPTYYYDYYVGKTKKPFIVTVHDLIPELYQDIFFSANHNLLIQRKKVIENATRVIAISENTKKDLVEFYKIAPDKIDVIYHGPNTFKKDKIENKWGKYLLYVGSRESYKNFDFFISSISNLLSRYEDIKVICVGSKFTNKEIKFLEDLGLYNKIISIQADNTTLYQLYSNAICFVYPSLYEGFGMPILEAFDCGCPVVMSNTSSMPEVAVDSGIYFDPKDSHSIATNIEKVIVDSDLRSELISNGYKRLNYFSWDKCVEETQKTYLKCLV